MLRYTVFGFQENASIKSTPQGISRMTILSALVLLNARKGNPRFELPPVGCLLVGAKVAAAVCAVIFKNTVLTF